MSRASTAPKSARRIKTASARAVLPNTTVVQVTDDDDCPLPSHPNLSRFVKVVADGEEITLNEQQAQETLRALRGFLNPGDWRVLPVPSADVVRERDEALETLETVRSELARLHWYAHQYVCGKAGIDKEGVLVEFGDAASEIGIALNMLSDRVQGLVKLAAAGEAAQ